jgi:hypothetical protein
MKTIKKDREEKTFDAVKMMREIRSKIYLDTKNMSFEELRAYIDEKLAAKKHLIGQSSSS